jgi:hypothetical protein
MAGGIWDRSHGAHSSAHEERLALIDVNYTTCPTPRDEICALFQVGMYRNSRLHTVVIAQRQQEAMNAISSVESCSKL